VPSGMEAAVPSVVAEVEHCLLLRFRNCCKSLPLQPDCRNLNKMPLAKTPSINDNLWFYQCSKIDIPDIQIRYYITYQ
jgi:hypothetical protein